MIMDVTKAKELVQGIAENYGEEFEELLFADGFEDAFIGVGQQFNTKFAVYDRAKCIEILCRDMDEEQAEEFFQFNVEQAWFGENTPVFLIYDHRANTNDEADPVREE
jgi:hypothetical protein